jgi:hypothetical protein
MQLKPFYFIQSFLGAREIFFVINNFELLLRTFMCPYMFGPNYFTAFNLSLAD